MKLIITDESGKGLVEIGNDILQALDPHIHPDQPVGDPVPFFFFAGHTVMGHGCRVGKKAVTGAKGNGSGAHF